MAVGTDDPDEAADALLAAGVQLAIVKLGADGSLLATAEGRWRVPPVPVRVVCGLGAGDAFGGALAHGLLSGWDIERIGRFANAAGAFVSAQLTCADAMPSVSRPRGDGGRMSAALDREQYEALIEARVFEPDSLRSALTGRVPPHRGRRGRQPADPRRRPHGPRDAGGQRRSRSRSPTGSRSSTGSCARSPSPASTGCSPARTSSRSSRGSAPSRAGWRSAR